MKTTVKKVSLFMLAALLLALFAFAVAISVQHGFAIAADDDAVVEEVDAAQESLEVAEQRTKQMKGLAAAIIIAVVATAGAVSMGLAISKAIDGIARQPEAEGKIRTTLMLGLVFIETAIIYALIVAILVIFVL